MNIVEDSPYVTPPTQELGVL